MRLSEEGLDFIKRWEKFVPFLYDDLAPSREWNGGRVRGALTVGYGHTSKGADPIALVQGLRISETEASHILRNDLAPVEAAVRAAVEVPLTQHQFDALVSFRFNTGRLAGTTLLTRINAGRLDAAPAEFRRWVRSKGRVLKGLRNRREGEIALWERS